MVKKLFALASVTALTGVFAAGALAGCSSDSDTGPGGDPTVDGGKDSTAPKKDAPVGDDEEEPGATCPKAIEWDLTALETELGAFKAPKGIAQGVCSDAEIETFKTNAGKAGTPWNDLVKGVNAECGKCIVSSNTDANWGVIVTIAPENKNGLINWGACSAAAQGDAQCGVGMNNVQYCLQEDCPDECGANGSNQSQACIQKSLSSGSCKASLQQMTGACTKGEEIDAICGNTILTAAAAICGSGNKDGGKD